MEEVKIKLENEEVDRGGEVLSMVSFKIFIQMTSILNDGYSRQLSCLALAMLRTYLEKKTYDYFTSLSLTYT